jgi:hypothetical protein
MSDDADNSIDPVAARTLEVRAQALAFREAVYHSMKQYEDAVWRAGWDGGWNAGHAQGWADAVEQMRRAADRNRAEPIVTPPQPEPPGPAFEETSAAALVLRIIGANPGLRGVQILEIAERQGIPMKERTMRTALHRAKLAGKLRNVDERWFLIEDGAKPRKLAKGDSS